MTNARMAWLLLLVTLGALVVHVQHAAETELAQGREAERTGDVEGAIIHYRRAASWYAPFLSAPHDARAKLRVTARQAAEQKSALIELQAQRALWSSLHATRWLWVSGNEPKHLAQRIATLSVQAAPIAVGDGRPLERRVASLQAELLAQTRPHPLGLVCAVLGAWCWIAAVFLFAAHGLDEEQRLTPRARPLGTAFVVGFGMFVLGLALA